MTTKTLQKELKTNVAYIALATCESDATKASYKSAWVSFIRADCANDPKMADKFMPDGKLIDNPFYGYPFGGLTANKVELTLSEMVNQEGKPIKPRTYNKFLAAIKKPIRILLRDSDLVAANFNFKDYMRYDQILKLKSRKIKNKQSGQYLSPGEWDKLSSVCAEDDTPRGARDNAIFGWSYQQGPRVSEIVKLQLEDYDPVTGNISIIGAKGGKDRANRVQNSAKDAIDLWLQLRGDEPGPLFTRISKSGKIEIAPLTQQAISKLLFKRADQASIQKFSPHDLRRSYITRELGNGTQITLIAKIVGHASIITTQQYDLTDVEEALKASGRSHYPNKMKFAA